MGGDDKKAMAVCVVSGAAQETIQFSEVTI